MAKHIHIHLDGDQPIPRYSLKPMGPPRERKSSRLIRWEREYEAHKGLMASITKSGRPMPPEMVTKAKWLREEMDKARAAETQDATYENPSENRAENYLGWDITTFKNTYKIYDESGKMVELGIRSLGQARKAVERNKSARLVHQTQFN